MNDNSSETIDEAIDIFNVKFFRPSDFGKLEDKKRLLSKKEKKEAKAKRKAIKRAKKKNIRRYAKKAGFGQSLFDEA